MHLLGQTRERTGQLLGPRSHLATQFVVQQVDLLAPRLGLSLAVLKLAHAIVQLVIEPVRATEGERVVP